MDIIQKRKGPGIASLASEVLNQILEMGRIGMYCGYWKGIIHCKKKNQ
jgi:hypothetical protein